ncbi:ras small monomeric gtpase [Ophiostoma piceae UAMH 11346]|uniref:Ras small monomeric gtpase n=1 Tax=Ophiostoma piceae (strain UAMH 11346) TaxID=1262450 RepID=S3BZY2_OPHP1|nr:ras small monomeric gtpase [Ophiostoma piceae UAMH 11346]
MGSMHWTADESHYLKAIFTWQDRYDDEQDGGTRVRDDTIKACAGDLRVLIIGAQGVGKTALLTRFCGDVFTDEPDERFTRGGRRPIRIDKLLYNMDVLEMPSQHLVEAEDSKGIEDNAAPEGPVFGSTAATRRGRSNYPQCTTQSPAAMMLEQALAITEAAIIVYDACNAASFQQASRLYERLLRESGREKQKREGKEEQYQLLPGSSTSTGSKKQPKQRSIRFRSFKTQKGQTTSSPHDSDPPKVPHSPPRPFALLLVGNKSDVSDSERHVSWVDGSKVAGSNVFLEASAKEDVNVDNMFVQIGQQILRQRAEDSKLRERTEIGSKETMDRKSSSASLSKARPVPGIKNQTPRRPFILRVLGLSFGRRSLNTPVAI